MVNIIVTRRSSDFHAQVGDDPCLWGCGDSVDEAVGSCVMNHRKNLGIGVVIR